ncbi:MAG: alpha-L-arabinofuranosidase C-terminal domain-containing protein [Limisphaerales bacterium]
MKNICRIVVAAGLFVTINGHTQSAANVSIQVNQPGAVVSSNLFGIFFEEINFAGEGGLYAEMVRNRAMYSASNPYYWTQVRQGSATGTMTVDPTQPLNTNIPNSLKLTMTGGTGSVGAANAGYWGMNLTAGAAYNLNFYAMASAGFTGPIVAQLENAAGTTVYAQASFGGLTGAWQNFSASLVPNTTDTNAQLVLVISRPAAVWLDLVSLIPAATFDNRANGLRPDLANMLQALHPSFLRCPGGNFIEGDNVTNSVRWKKTIGPISQRPGHMNDAWGYWTDDGYGVDEMFQQCQDMGMTPLYAINAGLALGSNGNTNNTVPLDQMGPWVQDALDLIQYANGATNTTWGALRAANGHPAPYNLQYMEIGNENGGSYYDDRYALFYNAIKSSYPSMHLIVPDWGGIPTATPVEIEDQHYYENPGTFISYATMYDNYSRSGPKVFVGEYAVTSGYGAYGNLSAALGEASFMTGIERNSDVVLMASYAPLFGNVNSMQWKPNLIYFNSSQVFGTPSYYVQEMFSQNRGNAVLPTTVTVATNTAAAPRGTIGLGSWNTSVQYTNIVVTNNDVTLYQSDFADDGTNGWDVFNGTWDAEDGTYQQTAQITDCYSIYTNGAGTNWANYTITLQAMKTGGAEGFLIQFNVLDDYNWTWWNIGGWTDTQDAIEQMVGGNKTTYAQVPQYIQTGVWYYIKIVLNGAEARCYLGTNSQQAATNLVQDVTLPSATSGLLVSSTYADPAGQVVVKAVNPYSTAVTTTFNLNGVSSIAPSGTLIQLTSPDATDENSFAAPTYVFPVTNSISDAGTNFTVTLPANSLSILRLTPTGINNYTNLQIQIHSPITNGLTVPSIVLGGQSGNWINLTANSNHAIIWSSSNTNIAVVDIYGNVTGIGLGTATITASYPALGLSASQNVRVVYIPATLTHRYSMADISGTNVPDSIGGPLWNGTLPNGGAVTNGFLTFSSARQQFLNLPGGIVSNYLATTIDMWIPEISGSSDSPPFVYLFAFGNTDSSGNGYDYIFFNPNIARATISATDPGYNGEQGGNLSSLGSVTNLHLTCIFNAPVGTILVYTNGVLAASFTGINDPLSTVGNEFAYVGRSLYSADSYLDWSLRELRIYSGALSPAEIAASDTLGPGQLLSNASPPVSPSQTAPGFLTLSWPLASAGFTPLMTTNLLSRFWTPVPSVPSQIINGQWQIMVPISTSDEYFMLEK